MYIQIDNAGFYNKGAELMLLAIIQRLSNESQIINPKFVAGNGCQAPDYMQIRRTGLYQIPKFFRFYCRIDKLLPQFALEQYGLVKEESINVILDAGGFQFGDQWVYSYTKDRNNQAKQYYRKYKKQGAKIVFLPQAFGPFTNQLAKERIKIVSEYTDIFYVRESTSLNYLVDVLGKDERIRLAPDFTILVKPEANPSLLEKVKDSVCVIPNARMIDKTAPSVSKQYLDFLFRITESIILNGKHLVLLNHEWKSDWALIERITDRLKEYQDRIIALNNLNALEVKSVIGASNLLITSRYHGLVSGLNQRIPSLCTSWNHKYDELINEYSVKDSLLDTTNEIQFMSTLNNALAYPEKYRPSIQTIDKLKTKSISMWNEVLEVISS